MRWMFAVFVLSLCALLWAAISVARHIRRDAHGLPAQTGVAAAPGTEADTRATQPETMPQDTSDTR